MGQWHVADASPDARAAPGVIAPMLGKRAPPGTRADAGQPAAKSVAMSHHSGSVWSMRTSSPSMSSAMATMCILISVPWGTAKAPLDCTMAGFSARQCTRISRPVMGVNHVFRPSTASSSSPRYCERRRTYPSHTAYRGRFRAASWRPQILTLQCEWPSTSATPCFGGCQPGLGLRSLIKLRSSRRWRT